MFHEKHYYNPLPLHLPCNMGLSVCNMPPFSTLLSLFLDSASPFSAYKTTSTYKKEYRFCYITLNLYLCIKHLTRYEQRT